ncbi:MAG: peptidoglycan DD-metalloendopeptidase family protein [Parabacteroides sp.]
MRIRTVIFIFCTTIIASSVEVSAQGHRIQSIHIRKVSRHASGLVVDRVGFKKDIEMKKLSELSEKAVEAREDQLYPADELYGSWDNKWVDPFRSGTRATFPDTCKIDLSTFVYPIALNGVAEVTSPFGPRRRRLHKGIDLRASVGDTIRSAFAGRVRISNFERRGYGNYLVVRHPNGLETVYGHLSKMLVNVNDIVTAGEPIALAGNTGRSTGPHLHFETRFLGRALNPADIIDFRIGVPYDNLYVFHNKRINGRKSYIYEYEEDGLADNNIYTSSSNQLVYHRIKPGDTLGKIAHMYGTTIKALCSLNGLKRTSKLRIGQSIRCGSQTVRADKGLAKVKEKHKGSVEVDESSDNVDNTSEVKAVYHRVKSGDTLGGIALKHGTTVTKICKLNGITKSTLLKLGRSLRCS